MRRRGPGASRVLIRADTILSSNPSTITVIVSHRRIEIPRKVITQPECYRPGDGESYIEVSRRFARSVQLHPRQIRDRAT